MSPRGPLIRLGTERLFAQDRGEEVDPLLLDEVLRQGVNDVVRLHEDAGLDVDSHCSTPPSQCSMITCRHSFRIVNDEFDRRNRSHHGPVSRGGLSS
jgi:hypothetical protein